MVDTGYMILKNVRIPRRHMLAKVHYVDENGKLVKSNEVQDKKAMYASMMFTRVHIVYSAFVEISRATIIAIRYACVRQ